MGFGYRFGFQGQEGDDEISGSGNSYDFGARIYDSRLGRWMSVDPLWKKGPEYSPYNFAFNSPLKYSDEDGNWPKLEGWYGVTFFFFEGEIGAGLSYGLNYIRQEGVAYDEVGKTKFVMTSALYIVNQNLKDGSRDPNLISGASFSLTANVKQNLSSETFTGILGKGSTGVPLPIGKGGYGLVVNIGFSTDEISLGVGVGAGVKISYVSTSIQQSISLVDAEVDLVENATEVFTENWLLNNVTEQTDSEGNITGYKATVATKNIKGELIDTGIEVYSGASKNKDGTVQSNGVYTSESYDTQAAQAEKDDEG